MGVLIVRDGRMWDFTVFNIFALIKEIRDFSENAYNRRRNVYARIHIFFLTYLY